MRMSSDHIVWSIVFGGFRRINQPKSNFGKSYELCTKMIGIGNAVAFVWLPQFSGPKKQTKHISHCSLDVCLVVYYNCGLVLRLTALIWVYWGLGGSQLCQNSCFSKYTRSVVFVAYFSNLIFFSFWCCCSYKLWLEARFACSVCRCGSCKQLIRL